MEYKEQMTSAEFREFIKTRPSVFKKTGLSQSLNTKEEFKSQNNHGSIKVWYEVGGKRCFFRSTWEINYAMILDFKKKQGLIKDWHYEDKEFWFIGIKRGVCSYKTDFKIVKSDDTHEWHEVKGYMDSRSATKLKRMAKYYPLEKVILIDKITLNILKKQIPCNYVKKSDFQT